MVGYGLGEIVLMTKFVTTIQLNLNNRRLNQYSIIPLFHPFT
jgi:hypothetical protein